MAPALLPGGRGLAFPFPAPVLMPSLLLPLLLCGPLQYLLILPPEVLGHLVKGHLLACARSPNSDLVKNTDLSFHHAAIVLVLSNCQLESTFLNFLKALLQSSNWQTQPKVIAWWLSRCLRYPDQELTLLPQSHMNGAFRSAMISGSPSVSMTRSDSKHVPLGDLASSLVGREVVY